MIFGTLCAAPVRALTCSFGWVELRGFEPLTPRCEQSTACCLAAVQVRFPRSAASDRSRRPRLRAADGRLAAACNSWHLAMPGAPPPGHVPRGGGQDEHRGHELGMGELAHLRQ